MKPININSIEDWMLEKDNFSKLGGCRGHGCTYRKEDMIFGCDKCAVNTGYHSKLRKIQQLGAYDDTSECEDI